MAKNNQVPSLIERFPGKRVLLLGDVMLDEYIYGDVSRISPEAPVPVVEIEKRIFAPGGAANAAMNIIDLGGEVLLCGAIGVDSQADILCDCINKKAGIKIKLFIDDQKPTTTKTRVIARNQQVVRMDYERKSLIDQAIEEKVIAWVDASIGEVDVCVLSDYDKGLLTWKLTSKVIEMARAANLPIIVDPKCSNFTKYRFATIVTPNLNEFEQAVGEIISGEMNFINRGRNLRSLLEGSALLVTQGSEGMTLFSDEAITHIPAMARKVYDVTGAGDTVVSVLAIALASGAELYDAAFLANIAAGIVVGKIGTATVSPNEILQWVKQYNV